MEGLRQQQRRDPSLSSEKRAWRCGGVNAAKLGGSFLQRYMDETFNKRSYLLQAALETGFGPQRVRAPRRLRPSSDHRPNLTRLPGVGVGVGVAVLLYPTHELEQRCMQKYGVTVRRMTDRRTHYACMMMRCSAVAMGELELSRRQLGTWSVGPRYLILGVAVPRTYIAIGGASCASHRYDIYDTTDGCSQDLPSDSVSDQQFEVTALSAVVRQRNLGWQCRVRWRGSTKPSRR